MRKDFERKKGYKNTPRRVKSSKETFAQAFVRQCAAAGVDNFDKEGLTRRGFVPTHIEAAFANPRFDEASKATIDSQGAALRHAVSTILAAILL